MAAAFLMPASFSAKTCCKAIWDIESSRANDFSSIAAAPCAPRSSAAAMSSPLAMAKPTAARFKAFRLSYLDASTPKVSLIRSFMAPIFPLVPLGAFLPMPASIASDSSVGVLSGSLRVFTASARGAGAVSGLSSPLSIACAPSCSALESVSASDASGLGSDGTSGLRNGSEYFLISCAKPSSVNPPTVSGPTVSVTVSWNSIGS